MDYGIRCGGCGQTVPEGIGHTCTNEPPYKQSNTEMVIKKYTLSCPSCAGKDERIKELEEKLRVHENPKHWPKWKKDFAEDVYGRKIDWDSFKKEG